MYSRSIRTAVQVGRRWCSSPAATFESKLTIAVKKKDFVESANICKAMTEASIAPTPRVYLLLLQLYLDSARDDPSISVECGYTTFEKAHKRSFTKTTPALWTSMMMIYGRVSDPQGARELDKLRASSGIPVPEGSMYKDALKQAISSERANKLPPTALRDDRDFNKTNIKKQLEMERERV
eukprot:TRINITY_DN9892_c0_g1_i1.p1 TRINITY_DN9892_c0_g1~~TRINITY_DN9892_c0_g1_i1.p1  ORF type:complete len:181 (+),score=29.12 TRINITY_DN9892_c0_g1_i1:121-663(+)